MDLGIQGKVALITGSGRGLGAATAHKLASEGCRIIVTDIVAERVEQTTNTLKQAGFEAHGIVADITKASEVKRLVDEAIATFGSIDIEVNNAGSPRDKYLVKMAEDDWDFVIDVMLKGAFLVTRAVMPFMIENQWGRVINMSSRAHFGNPTQANYATAKAGLIGLAKAVAIEEGRYNITVNCVAPGFIESEMIQALDTYEIIKERALKAQPVKRPGTPEDVADAIAFLASERAGFISGEVLHVTGGRYG